MKVIKNAMYNVVNTEPFEMPAPLQFELLNGNSLLASYTVHEDGKVDYSFNPSSNEKILTSTNRPLGLNDIYFLFSSRVFPNNTPFTRNELERFGVDEYNPYDIIRKSHGIMPADRYWFRFSDESLTYKKASENFGAFFANPVTDKNASDKDKDKDKAGDDKKHEKDAHMVDAIMHQKMHEFTSINDVASIMKQNTLDIGALAANAHEITITESAFVAASEKPALPPDANPEKAASALNKAVTEFKQPAKGEKTSEPAKEEASSGGMMSPEAIAALLAGNSESEAPETAEVTEVAEVTETAEVTASEPVKAESPAPASSPSSSGGNMSPEDIAALLAGNSESADVTETAEVSEVTETSETAEASEIAETPPLAETAETAEA